ncbi:MAG: HAMP domain-containing histidine kinase [Opitutae bacterium]|nr:HAMP domain-containing histidine kinase [Opitutae bacterium]
MSTSYILATADPALASAWERQIPPGRQIVRLHASAFSACAMPGLSAVVVLDATEEERLPAAFAKCPTIYVGEPRSLPFEQARLSGRAKVFLSYEDSAKQLREFIALVEEIAEKQTMVDLLIEKTRRAETPRRAPPALPATETGEIWDFLEGAVENLDSRDRLLGEFRRATRQLLRASHAVFFLRESDGFRADRGTSFCPFDDPMVAYLENHPAVIDGATWEGPVDPVAELAVRNRLAMWGARLLVPIHDNGHLLGMVALGIRDDGQAYDTGDWSRAIFLARLLRQFLIKSAQLARLHHQAEQSSLGTKYLPGTLILGDGENVPRHLPLVVRDLVGRVRRSHEVHRVKPTAEQPFRASAGMIAETGGVWAFWEEASSEVHDAATRARAERLGLFRELALTLSHELGNALVSLSTFRQTPPERELPAPLLDTVKDDVAKLETLAQRLTLMQALEESAPTPVDLRELVQKVGQLRELPVEVGPAPVLLQAAPRLLEFALGALLDTMAENRAHHPSRDTALQLRSTGAGAELTALLSFKGKHLELEGILPEPQPDSVPNQGRIGVFLAKEIIRLHHGEIHAGPGMEGTEILVSLRSL